MGLESIFDFEVERLERENLLRFLPPYWVEYNVSRGTVEKDGEKKEVFIFCSNDYLGMTRRKEVAQEIIEGVLRYGSGSGAARLVSGNFKAHQEFEDFIRYFFELTKKGKDVLIFNSGWCANVGVIPAICGGVESAEIFSDELNHASIIDGCRLSKVKVSVFRHRDCNHLESLLSRSSAKLKLVVVDSIFSMDGDISPLKDIRFLCERYSALFYVDEAHAFGIFGEKGKGISDELGVEPDIALFTLSKAVGLYGAFLIAEKNLIKFLRSRARSFIFSTSLPPFILSAAKKSIEIIGREGERRRKVLENASFLRNRLKEKGLSSFLTSFPVTTQITPFILGDSVLALSVSRELFERGFFVQAIRYPSVPRDKSRLRITVTSEHSREDIALFVEALADIMFHVKQGNFSYGKVERKNSEKMG
jgi:8-amino-7-oxononanoate synthase